MRKRDIYPPHFGGFGNIRAGKYHIKTAFHIIYNTRELPYSQGFSPVTPY